LSRFRRRIGDLALFNWAFRLLLIRKRKIEIRNRMVRENRIILVGLRNIRRLLLDDSYGGHLKLFELDFAWS
jgi:hypothetical protein